jgi:hypothetical protein
MTEPFENEVKVIVGTQRIVVDPAGRVTIVNAGPVGPRGVPGSGGTGGGTGDHGELDGLDDDDHQQYFNEARGDDRYSLLGHTHPEYAQFTYGLGLAGDGTLVGGTYNIDGTVTMPILSVVGLPVSTDFTILFYESPDSAYDKGYIYTTSAVPEDNTWVLTPYDDPFSFQSIGKIISINFDFAANDSIVGQIYYDGAFKINALAWGDHTHPPDPDGDWAAAIHTHPVSVIDGAQADLRVAAQEYLRDEWEKRTAPIMVTNPTAELMNGNYDSTWAITRATTRGTLPHTPNGVDIQWFGKVRRPYTQAELNAAGHGYLTAGDPPDGMYQSFYELMTLVRPSIMNDWFEWARFMGDILSPAKGKASYFWEGTPIGAPKEDPNNSVADSGQEVGQPERSRITVDCSSSTLTFWYWVPYYNGDPTLQQCPRGLWWKPFFSQTHSAWASMADPESETVPAIHEDGFTEGDPEVIQPWRVGIQARLEIGELFFYRWADTTPLLHIDAAVLEDAGVGVTTFLDGTGVTTVSTVTAYTAPGPAARFVPVDSPKLLPDPTSEPDNKWVKTTGGGYVLVDAPSSAGSAVSIDASGFNGNLETTDDTAQKVAQKFDDVNFNLGILQPKRGAGYYHSLPFPNAHTTVTIASNAANSALAMLLTPMFVREDTPYDRIGVYCSTAATDAGAVLEMGWCPATPAGIPDYASAEVGGSQSILSIGLKEVTLGAIETLPTGLWWLLGAFKTSGTFAGVNPAFYAATSTFTPREGAIDTNNLGYKPRVTRASNGAVNAGTGVAWDNTGTLIWARMGMRVAA